MSYEIETKDGIVIRGIPDNIKPDHPSIKAKVEKARDARNGEMALEGMSGTQKFLAGVGKGMTDIGRGVAQVVGLGDQQAIDEARARDAALTNTGAGLAGDIAGNLALTMIPGVGAQGLLTRGAASVLPRLIAPTAAAATTGAGISAATTPVASNETRAAAAGAGAVGGAVGDVGARLISRAVQPIRQSDAVKRLLSEGVVPTPGQAAGANSVLGQTEQKLQSVFGVGDIVKMGRDRAGTEMNQAALSRAMPPGAGKVSQAGLAGLDEADNALSAAYDKVFSGKKVSPDAALSAAVNAARNIPALPLNEASEKTFDAVLKKNLFDRIPANGTMPADKMKSEIIGDLGKVARDHLNGQTASEKALGQALMEARNQAQSWLAAEVAKTSPNAAMQIQMIDRAYANKVAIAKAVERAKAAGGKFTPNQLQNATKQGQDLRALANDAQEALGSRVADSGSIGRASAAMALLGGGTVGANEYFGGPGYLSALAAAPLLYSRAGSRYMIGNMIPGQQSLAALARASAPYASQAGRAYNTEKR